MSRFIFIPDEKNGKQMLDGKRGTLVTVSDDKAKILSPHHVLTEKPAVTDYVAPEAPQK